MIATKGFAAWSDEDAALLHPSASAPFFFRLESGTVSLEGQNEVELVATTEWLFVHLNLVRLNYACTTKKGK